VPYRGLTGPSPTGPVILLYAQIKKCAQPNIAGPVGLGPVGHGGAPVGPGGARWGPVGPVGHGGMFIDTAVRLQLKACEKGQRVILILFSFTFVNFRLFSLFSPTCI